jgi:hypothetical protein
MLRKWEGTLRACSRRWTKGGEPDAVKAASPVRRGGMGRRTERQRVLSLPDVLRLMGCFVLMYTSRVVCKGRLTMEEILFSLKHYWRFVDSDALELKALS